MCPAADMRGGVFEILSLESRGVCGGGDRDVERKGWDGAGEGVGS